MIMRILPAGVGRYATTNRLDMGRGKGEEG